MQLRGGQIGQPLLARADDVLRQFGLLLDHLIDPLLQRAKADELVHLHRAHLADAERAVGRLILNRGIPPTVVVEHVIRRGEVQPQSARLERQHEDRHSAIGSLEAIDESLALVRRRPAVQEKRFAIQVILNHRGQEVAHLAELAEDEGLLAAGDDFLQHPLLDQEPGAGAHH